MSLTSAAFAVFLSIPIGIISAIKQNTWIDNLLMVLALIGVAMPAFWQGLMTIILFSVKLGWFPSYGFTTPAHWFMPVLTIGTGAMASLVRITRSSMLEVMNQDYIILARSKGTPYKKVVIKHALKNAMLPVVTYAGPMFAFMLTGSFVIESVFSIPGIGSAFVSCITTRDYPIIMGLTIFLGFLVITFNLITDILSAIIDPRIKLD
mgnify:FL=1